MLKNKHRPEGKSYFIDTITVGYRKLLDFLSRLWLLFASYTPERFMFASYVPKRFDFAEIVWKHAVRLFLGMGPITVSSYRKRRLVRFQEITRACVFGLGSCVPNTDSCTC